MGVSLVDERIYEKRQISGSGPGELEGWAVDRIDKNGFDRTILFREGEMVWLFPLSIDLVGDCIKVASDNPLLAVKEAKADPSTPLGYGLFKSMDHQF